MPRYYVVIERYAEKHLQKIDRKMIPVLRNAILDLGNNPRPHGYEKLKGIEA
jgi:mRNA interferase RelE/StbE